MIEKLKWKRRQPKDGTRPTLEGHIDWTVITYIGFPAGQGEPQARALILHEMRKEMFKDLPDIVDKLAMLVKHYAPIEVGDEAHELEAAAKRIFNAEPNP